MTNWLPHQPIPDFLSTQSHNIHTSLHSNTSHSYIIRPQSQLPCVCPPGIENSNSFSLKNKILPPKSHQHQHNNNNKTNKPLSHNSTTHLLCFWEDTCYKSITEPEIFRQTLVLGKLRPIWRSTSKPESAYSCFVYTFQIQNIPVNFRLFFKKILGNHFFKKKPRVKSNTSGLLHLKQQFPTWILIFTWKNSLPIQF